MFKRPKQPRDDESKSQHSVAGRTRFLILACSLALSILAIEATLRWWGRVPIPPDRVVSARPELYQANPAYGYCLWPSLTTTYMYPRQNPRVLTVRSNRHGFRGGRELDESDVRPRVAILGDSQVFGEGVEESERFTEQLEARKPEWRVDNLGMTGFGPDLMLRAFEQVGRPLLPQVVVLVMYTDDFRRVRPEYAGPGFEIPRFALSSGRLVSIEYPRRTFWTQWSTVAAIRAAAWRASGREWDLNEAILDRFREHARVAPFQFVLVFLPGRSDTPNDVKRRTWLRSYAERTGTLFLDLTDAILHSEGQTAFIQDNQHLNPRGHVVVANQLEGLLSKTVLGVDGSRVAGRS
jgi:hypothetical protein